MTTLKHHVFKALKRRDYQGLHTVKGVIFGTFNGSRILVSLGKLSEYSLKQSNKSGNILVFKGNRYIGTN